MSAALQIALRILFRVGRFVAVEIRHFWSLSVIAARQRGIGASYRLIDTCQVESYAAIGISSERQAERIRSSPDCRMSSKAVSAGKISSTGSRGTKSQLGIEMPRFLN